MYDGDLDDLLNEQKTTIESEFEDVDIDDVIDRAETGDDDWQLMAGIAYLHGIKLHRNFDKAVKWLEKSARQGNMCAEYFFGFCYALGLGVEEDLDEAIRWIRKSVKHGYTEAKPYLKKLEELYD